VDFYFFDVAHSTLIKFSSFESCSTLRLVLILTYFDFIKRQTKEAQRPQLDNSQHFFQSFILDSADFIDDIRLIECYLADSIASDALWF
jgi:hypothetical protein